MPFPRLIALVMCLGVALLATTALARTVKTHHCPTFTGPGDSQVHSRNFRVAHITCATGKKVVETCREDGSKCHVKHATWRCHGQIPGEEHCLAGRRVASIYWLD